MEDNNTNNYEILPFGDELEEYINPNHLKELLFLNQASKNQLDL